MAYQPPDVSSAALYKSPISDAMNMRFTENRIIVERAAQEVFDWVTTWANVPKWLPVAKKVSAIRGDLDKPSKLGDVVIETIDPTNTDGIDKQYTVVAQVDGFLQTVAGGDVVDGQSSDRIQYVATFAVQPIDCHRCVLTRVFQSVRSNTVSSNERGAVENPAAIQKGLKHLKHVLESS